MSDVAFLCLKCFSFIKVHLLTVFTKLNGYLHILHIQIYKKMVRTRWESTFRNLRDYLSCLVPPKIQHKFYKNVNKWNMTTTNIKKQTI